MVHFAAPMPFTDTGAMKYPLRSSTRVSLASWLLVAWASVPAAFAATGASDPPGPGAGATNSPVVSFSKEPSPVPPLKANPAAYAYVVISVADMDQALGLWVSRFGMQVVARREGTDPGLARVWGIDPGEIIDQALLLTPGMEQGGVHLVRFKVPGPAVREGAASTDLVPKSVDIAAHDLPARFAELTAAGYKFRSPIGRFETDNVVVHEVHLPGPEGVNLVFLEQEGKPEPVSDKGYGVAPQIVAISPDNKREKAFFEQVMGLWETSYNRFSGPVVEKTIGLPKGAALDIRIFGDPTYDYGRLEIVQYEGVQSANLYPKAKPPARGMLSVTFFVPSVAALLAKAPATAAPVDHGNVDTIFGRAHLATLTSPAGLRIDLVEHH
jgi:catechol 2,3-dioxygenase-like lactoylglutathione lyase family enzyme